jgi:hypothetical protein
MLMAEVLGALGIGGAGGIGSGIGEAVGDFARAIARVIAGIARAIARVGSTLYRGFVKVLDKLAHALPYLYRLFLRFMNWLRINIIWLFRASVTYMRNFYYQFQRDPLTSLQFMGTLVIAGENLGLFG